MTLWYKDKQEMASATQGPQAKGVAYNANFMVGENHMVFFRVGFSDGYPVIDRNLSTGFGWRFPQAPSDLFGFGIGWAHPASDALRGQYTEEIFYRFHITGPPVAFLSVEQGND